MTREQMKSFKVKEEVGYYGNVATVLSYYEKNNQCGINISVPQKDSEVRTKSLPKTYLITDATQVLRKVDGEFPR